MEGGEGGEEGKGKGEGRGRGREGEGGGKGRGVTFKVVNTENKACGSEFALC